MIKDFSCFLRCLATLDEKTIDEILEGKKTFGILTNFEMEVINKIINESSPEDLELLEKGEAKLVFYDDKEQ